MTDRKTTFRIGFDADIRELRRANQEVENLRRQFDRLAASSARNRAGAPSLPPLIVPSAIPTPSGKAPRVAAGGQKVVQAEEAVQMAQAEVVVKGVGPDCSETSRSSLGPG